jgi:hypothetical protein
MKQNFHHQQTDAIHKQEALGKPIYATTSHPRNWYQRARYDESKARKEQGHTAATDQRSG